MEPLLLTHENFDEYVRNHKGKAVVDFWATWCAPCRVMSPILDELAEEAAEGFHVGKVNVDKEQKLAQEFRVMSIPTIVVFENGVEVERFIGVTDKEKLLPYVK